MANKPQASVTSADFPYAPDGWTPAVALTNAAAEGVELKADHWEAIGAIQEYFGKVARSGFKPRECTDALDEKFHARGGLKYLYVLFPGGPVARGCRMAGIPAPAGSTDHGFGSVQ
ncbi:MAG: TusE/DsrC/DsvC family sulfur relay protein [Gammaproteobacteria bacterium]|nr:TusE/DsrC/DsvC family sulfur relay protein [Gammaproteobacteria bacterium]